MDYVQLWTIISTIFMALWAVLKIIAPYTRTDKDDKIVKIISKLISVFSIQLKNNKLEIEIKQKE